jgi:hypothetical protein
MTEASSITTRRRAGSRDATRPKLRRPRPRSLELPIFVVTYPSPSSSRRNVDLAWVEEWDDDERLFLITFGESQPAAPPHPP